MNKLNAISETNPKSSSKQKNTIETLKKNSSNTKIETKFDKIFLSKKSQAKQEEEFRVWYVGITRTIENLYLIKCKNKLKEFKI